MTKEPLILAVETSSRVGSVAIARGAVMLAESSFSGPMRHSAEVFPAVSGLLGRFDCKPAEIDHVYISAGPGSFTGLRIAVTIAKAMHLANSARVVAVSALDVIAANLTDRPGGQPAETAFARAAAVLDAKRGQFFVAVYARLTKSGHTTHTIPGTQFQKNLDDCLMIPSQFIDRFADVNRPIWLLGDGLLYHADKFKAQGINVLPQEYWSPRARMVHSLGWQRACANRFADPRTLTPTYLRRPEIGASRIGARPK
jgi:tRNA threonylcarbamoyladenosine biosynthesis protein TsaB